MASKTVGELAKEIKISERRIRSAADRIADLSLGEIHRAGRYRLLDENVQQRLREIFQLDIAEASA